MKPRSAESQQSISAGWRSPGSRKKKWIPLVKFCISTALITFLLIGAKRSDPEVFNQLRVLPKNWMLLVAAVVCCLMAVLFQWVRWHVLASAIGIPIRRIDVLQWGFLAYMLDFAALGVIGGDLVRSALLARREPEHRAKAFASVVVDRIVGLLVTLTVACIAIESLPDSRLTTDLAMLIWAIQCITVAGLMVMLLALVLGRTVSRLSDRIEGIPKIGHVTAQLVRSVSMYRFHPLALAVAGLLSLLSLALNATGFALIAHALPGGSPTLIEHCVIVPLAQITAVLPLPIDALGVFDYALSFLYLQVTDGRASVGKGLLVAMGYHLASIVIATIGLCVYSVHRSQFSELLSEVASNDCAE